MLEDSRAMCISVSMNTGNRKRNKSGEGKKKRGTEDGHLECPFGMASSSVTFANLLILQINIYICPFNSELAEQLSRNALS